MSRLKNKVLPSRARAQPEGLAKVPVIIPPRPLGFPARVAEFLLVLRLRVYRRSAPSGSSIMARAANMLLVTCKSWFGGKGMSKRDSHKP